MKKSIIGLVKEFSKKKFVYEADSLHGMHAERGGAVDTLSRHDGIHDNIIYDYFGYYLSVKGKNLIVNVEEGDDYLVLLELLNDDELSGDEMKDLKECLTTPFVKEFDEDLYDDDMILKKVNFQLKIEES